MQNGTRVPHHLLPKQVQHFCSAISINWKEIEQSGAEFPASPRCNVQGHWCALHSVLWCWLQGSGGSTNCPAAMYHFLVFNVNAGFVGAGSPIVQHSKCFSGIVGMSARGVRKIQKMLLHKFCCKPAVSHNLLVQNQRSALQETEHKFYHHQPYQKQPN